MKRTTVAKEKKPLCRGGYITLTTLLSILITCFIAGFLLLAIYSIILTIATSSAMIFFIVFGAAVFSLALAFNLFFSIQAVRKIADKAPLFQAQAPKNAIQNSQNIKNTKNKFDEIVQIVAFITIIVAVVSIVISAALGSTSSKNWTNELASYRESNGYYSSNQKLDLCFAASQNSISINLDTKFAVVIYDENATEIKIDFYNQFSGQLQISQTSGSLLITENPSPKLDSAIEKMLFFVFTPTKNTQQIKIYIPAILQNSIVIEGEFIQSQD